MSAFLLTRTDIGLLPAIAELANLDQWIVWKLQERRNKRGEVKKAKVPYNPRTHRATTNELTLHCTSFEAAYAASSRYNGVGFTFTADDPYCGVDLDGCRDPQTGRITRWAWHWIMRLDSYAGLFPVAPASRFLLEEHLHFHLLRLKKVEKGFTRCEWEMCLLFTVDRRFSLTIKEPSLTSTPCYTY